MNKFTFGELFAGVGGMSLGLQRSGMTPAWHVEREPFAKDILAKHWPDVPCYDDVREFPPSGKSKKSLHVDLMCGGFPCCQVSNARTAQVAEPEGLEGEDSGLWFEFLRVVRVLRPRWVLVENVGALAVRGLDEVLRGLSAEGFDAEWAVLPASALGAPHLRKRLFIVAVQDAHGQGLEGTIGQILAPPKTWGHDPYSAGPAWWDAEPGLGRVVDGVPAGVDETGRKYRRPKYIRERLTALGNAVVPQVSHHIGRRILWADARRKKR